MTVNNNLNMQPNIVPYVLSHHIAFYPFFLLNKKIKIKSTFRFKTNVTETELF